MASAAIMPTTTRMQTFSMDDSSAGQSVSYSATPDPVRDATFADESDVTLQKFMERPVQLTSYTWTPGQLTPFSADFNPWTGFFLSPRVVNRVANYSCISAKLHVRFVINGSPFYYGRLMVDYGPLANYDQTSSYSTAIPANIVQASQRLKVFIDPSMCCSTQLDLPFIWPYEALDAAVGWGDMGNIYMRQLTELKHSNGSVNPITISVFVWASDVRLAAPTTLNPVGMVPQAGPGEYGQAPISNTATAISAAASQLTRVPVIGKYAMATSSVAASLGDFARMFGFSRPADLCPPTRMKPVSLSNMAVTDTMDTCDKLTVDSKQEISVDPSIVGVELPDEMTIAGIAARESFVTSYPWTVGSVTATHLWSAYVTPSIYQNTGGVIAVPACAFASQPFRYWRGTMRYRFQIVASAHHKGRLRVVYDPRYTVAPEANTQYTQIVDLDIERDFTIDVPWSCDKAYLPVGAVGQVPYVLTPLGVTIAGSNGVLSVFVLNSLTTPNSSINNDIRINVYVSCSEMEVRQPVIVPTAINTYSFTPQAGPDEGGEPNNPGCGGDESSYVAGESYNPDDLSKIYFGERIVSFRQLLRRYARHSTTSVVPLAGASRVTVMNSDVPAPLGYNAQTTTSAVTGKFAFVNNTLLNYLQPAFLAVRGSQRSKYIFIGMTPGSIVTVTQVPNTTLAPTTTVALTPTDPNAFARGNSLFSTRTESGAACIATDHQPVLEVEFPFYRNTRFDHARAYNNAVASTVQGSRPFMAHHVLDMHRPSTGTTSPVIIDRHVSVGEDFNLILFQGCPLIRVVAVPASTPP